jgi:predicted Zn-dependent peptidase
MNEIREKRSMAYTAYGYVSTPSIAGKDSYLFGYVGTQGDKVADAIDVFMGLLTDMPAPENAEERMENIRTYLHQSALTAKPGMRAKSQVFEQWKKLGYTDDPAKVNMTTIDNLTYEDIKAFYEANIKGKPVTIVVIGDPKTIDQKAIQAKWGKITKMSPNKLFKGGI